MGSKMGEKRFIPLYAKLIYTALYLVIVYSTVHNYSWMHLLWFSQTALFVVLIGMWAESRLLLSMASISILLFHSLWTIGFLIRLITGVSLFGGLLYMFDPQISLFLRGISMYHVALPFLILWILSREGYKPEAVKYQTVFAWFVATITFLVTPVQWNVNWVFGLVDPQQMIGPYLYLVIYFVGLPLVVYLPTHLVLKRLFSD